MKSELGKFIGYGINLMSAKGPFVEELKRAVLKTDEVFNDLVKSLPVLAGNIHSQSSESLSEIYSEWSVDGAIDIKAPFFSGGFKSEYSNKGRSNRCNNFFKGIVSVKGFSHLLVPRDNTISGNDALVDYLKKNGYTDSTALANINGAMTVQSVFANYGTHVIIGGLSGGCVQVCAHYTSDSSISEQKFNATMSFSCGFVTGSSSGGFTDEQKHTLSQTELNANSRGGDPTIIGSLNKYEQIPDIFQRWANSVNESNYVMTDISAVIPIWLFCDDQSRMQDFMSAFESSGNKQFALIESYFPAPAKEENVALHLAHHREYKVSENKDQFAITTTRLPLILTKELVKEGTSIFRFRVANSDRYLCVTNNGPSGYYEYVALNGKKDSNYAQFYLELFPDLHNSYYFRSVETGYYFVTRPYEGGTICATASLAGATPITIARNETKTNRNNTAIMKKKND